MPQFLWILPIGGSEGKSVDLQAKIQDLDSSQLRELASQHESLHWLAFCENYGDSVNTDLQQLLANLSLFTEIRSEKRIYLFCKRIFDVLIVLAFFPLLLPLFLLIAFAIKIDSPGPVLFKQRRVGRNFGLFQIYKFRTMVVGAERTKPFLENEMTGALFKVRQDSRLTRVGSILRRFSLDELPQLFNVLKGSMSLVGPRPLTLEDTSTIGYEHYERFAVLPGLTGYWQATIRLSKDGRQKIALDAEYIGKMGFGFDLYLLLKTLRQLLTERGV